MLPRLMRPVGPSDLMSSSPTSSTDDLVVSPSPGVSLQSTKRWEHTKDGLLSWWWWQRFSGANHHNSLLHSNP